MVEVPLTLTQEIKELLELHSVSGGATCGGATGSSGRVARPGAAEIKRKNIYVHTMACIDTFAYMLIMIHV